MTLLRSEPSGPFTDAKTSVEEDRSRKRRADRRNPSGSVAEAKMTKPGSSHILSPVDQVGAADPGILDLTDGEKFHTVVGIALNSVLIPGLKSYVDEKVAEYYKELVSKYKIDSPNSTLDVATIIGQNLGLNIHEKKCKHLREIKTHHQLAKHYMQKKMVQFDKITDGKTDAATILSIIGKARCFSDPERQGSKDLREKVRNEWAHCRNYGKCTEDKFRGYFNKMENFIKTFPNTFIGRSNILTKLAKLQGNGFKLLSPSVDQNLLKEFFVEYKINQFIQKMNMKNFLKVDGKVDLASQTFEVRVDKMEHGKISMNTNIQKLTEEKEQSRSLSLKDQINHYKNWIFNTENSQIRRKLDQLKIGGATHYITRKLEAEKAETEMSADEFLTKIQKGKTSLVSGPAGSGKSTLAVSTIVNWAESEGSSYDVVLFLSSLQKKEKLPLHKSLWGEYASRIGKDSEEIYQDLQEREGKILVIVDGLGKKNIILICILITTYVTRLEIINLFLDEIQIDKETEGRVISAAADPSRDVSLETMILGLLKKRILPGATVLGFSRSGAFTNREYLDDKSEVYLIKKLSSEDVKAFIENTTESEDMRERILQILENIDEDLRHEILFFKKIVQIVREGNIQLGEITTASDLFLTIIRDNLEYLNAKTEAGFSRLLADCKNNLKKIFTLCKQNLLKKQETDQAGVIRGTIGYEETWVSGSGLDIPISFLNDVGIFEIPCFGFDELTLTAKHLSFIEFFAAAGILLSSDIKSELGKIESSYRFKAVSVYIRKFFV